MCIHSCVHVVGAGVSALSRQGRGCDVSVRLASQKDVSATLDPWGECGRSPNDLTQGVCIPGAWSAA